MDNIPSNISPIHKDVQIEQRRDLIRELIENSVPFFSIVFKNLYEDVLRHVKYSEYILRDFQLALKKIPEWSFKDIEEKMILFSPVKNEIKSYLSNIHILNRHLYPSEIQIEDNNDLGLLGNFFKKTSIHIARELFKQPIIMHFIVKNGRTDAEKELAYIIEHAIEATIRRQSNLKALRLALETNPFPLSQPQPVQTFSSKDEHNENFKDHGYKYEQNEQIEQIKQTQNNKINNATENEADNEADNKTDNETDNGTDNENNQKDIPVSQKLSPYSSMGSSTKSSIESFPISPSFKESSIVSMPNDSPLRSVEGRNKVSHVKNKEKEKEKEKEKDDDSQLYKHIGGSVDLSDKSLNLLESSLNSSSHPSSHSSSYPSSRNSSRNSTSLSSRSLQSSQSSRHSRHARSYRHSKTSDTSSRSSPSSKSSQASKYSRSPSLSSQSSQSSRSSRSSSDSSHHSPSPKKKYYQSYSNGGSKGSRLTHSSLDSYEAQKELEKKLKDIKKIVKQQKISGYSRSHNSHNSHNSYNSHNPRNLRNSNKHDHKKNKQKRDKIKKKIRRFQEKFFNPHKKFVLNVEK